MRSLFKLFPLVVLAALCRFTAEAAQPDWECNSKDYQYDMSVYASLQIDGEAVAPADYLLAAFCGDECRGVATVQSAEGHQYYYLRVRSNQTEGEMITLQAYDRANDRTYGPANILTTIDFVNLQALGYPSAPIAIDCRNLYQVKALPAEHGSVTGAGEYMYNTQATLTAVPDEGYEFARWSNGAEDNPLTLTVTGDVEIGAEFAVLHYALTYVIDGETVSATEIAYGDPILDIEASEREGYTFSGWSEHPATMPAEDLTVTGTYTVNSYRLAYLINGEVVYETMVEYGAPIEYFEAPEREGFTFSGWSRYPETMPANDVTIIGHYIPLIPETCEIPLISYNGRYASISCETYGATIYYTLDSSIPTSEWTVYTSPFDTEGINTITAFASCQGYQDSPRESYHVMAYYDGELAICDIPGALFEAFGWTDTSVIESLKVEGGLDIGDFELLKGFGALKYLDLGETYAHDIPDEAFAGMGLVNVVMPYLWGSVGSSLFAGCDDLGAITWMPDEYSDAVPAQAYKGLAGRNTLVYTNRRRHVSVLTNVVVNNEAERIVLADKAGPVYVPAEFKARSISYTRMLLQTTPIKGCAGWEALSLPFDVQTVSHEREGVITSFAAADNDHKHYWLYGVGETGFAPATAIAANTPYVISMPNNEEYIGAYCLHGNVTFSSTDCTVPVTEATPRHFDYAAEGQTGRYAAWPTSAAVAQSDDVYALNAYMADDEHVAGSAYISGLRAIEPFEAYVTAESSAARVPVLDLARMLGEEDPTGIVSIDSDPLWGVTAYGGTLYISSGSERVVNIHDLAGRLVMSVEVGAGVTPVYGLSAGLYIVNATKVMVK